MKQESLVSNYTVTQFKPHVPKCNEEQIENVLNINFHHQPKHQVVVSDLTYVRVGKHKNSNLVMQTFSKVKINLKQIQIFHTDRGNEFKNKQIDETLKAFEIECSLSMKGCPYDNMVTEATYKIIKTEFIKNRIFASLKQLQIELANYINWFNNHRIHSSLDYLILKEYERHTLKKVV